MAGSQPVFPHMFIKYIIPIGIRRSARLQTSASERLDNNIARIMQDCILDDHILMRGR